MQVLLDTGVWWRWMTRGPIRRALRLTLVHTDTRLKGLPGFPQQYFPGVKG